MKKRQANPREMRGIIREVEKNLIRSDYKRSRGEKDHRSSSFLSSPQMSDPERSLREKSRKTKLYENY